MTDELKKVEYQVREVGRFHVTRYHEGENSVGSEPFGEFDNADVAFEVGYALALAEHRRLGWPIGDARITYPTHPIALRAALEEPNTDSASDKRRENL